MNALPQFPADFQQNRPRDIDDLQSAAEPFGQMQHPESKLVFPRFFIQLNHVVLAQRFHDPGSRALIHPQLLSQFRNRHQIMLCQNV